MDSSVVPLFGPFWFLLFILAKEIQWNLLFKNLRRDVIAARDFRKPAAISLNLAAIWPNRPDY